MNGKKILITGATGAVGSAVLKQLYSLRKVYNITVLVRMSRKTKKLLKQYKGINIIYGDLCNYNDVAVACTGQDYVIHLAAVIPPRAEYFPEEANKVNVGGTRNIVRALEDHAPNAFLLYSSSVAIYGDRLKSPEILTSDPLESTPWDAYGNSKIEAEKIIQNSNLNWTIYRLSAIMGIGNHKISKIMFHMPLETIMEITTVRDTARAFVNSIGKEKQLSNKVFNLGGGESCRISYLEFMTRAFDCYGMGPVNFPKYAFALQNYHCGSYKDGHLLEEIIHFRNDTVDTYFIRFGGAVPKIQRLLTKLVNRPVKWGLLMSSEPYRAHKKRDRVMIDRFFGSKYSF